MTQVSIYLVALQKQGLALPESTVAEVIPYEPLQRVQDTPDWFLGLLSWRGEQVPVASFEMLTVERASFSLVSVASASLVVIKGLNDQADLPFYALVSQTPPQLIMVEDEMLFATPEAVARTERAKVRFENDIVSIPHLDYIEASFRNVLIT
jgi:chemosensory pili system protein ChpC